MTVYDWPAHIRAHDQVFRGGQRIAPGPRTLGGFAVDDVEPGGVGSLLLTLPPFTKDAVKNVSASWLMTALPGNVLRYRLRMSPQLVQDADLGGAIDLAWENDLPWAGGVYWAWRPTAPVAAVAARGSPTVLVDLSDYGRVLSAGHVIGFKAPGLEFAHMVEHVAYSVADVATITVSPPLRRALAADDPMHFRPGMMMQLRGDAAGQFELRRRAVMGPLTFVEALL